MRITVGFQFEGIHSLPHLPDGNACKGLHGHRYEVKVAIFGNIDERTGFAGGVDYHDVMLFCRARVIDVLHHKNLDNFIKPQSTAERLAVWIWGQLAPRFPSISEVSVSETGTHWITYEGEVGEL
jgi:6-pyruvoyltetrahydropterin/6-carboxytetrahydropterin synthase